MQSKPVAPTMVNYGDKYDNTCPICLGPLRVAPYGVGNPADLRDIDDVDLFRSSWKTATLRCGHRFHRRCLASWFSPGGQGFVTGNERRTCPAGPHTVLESAPNGQYGYHPTANDPQPRYVRLSMHDNFDINEDINNNRVDPGAEVVDASILDNNEHQWYDDTTEKRDEVRNAAPGAVMADEAAKWSERLLAMDIDKKSMEARWERCNEMLKEREEQLLQSKKNLEELQETTKRMAQATGNEEAQAMITTMAELHEKEKQQLQGEIAAEKAERSQQQYKFMQKMQGYEEEISELGVKEVAAIIKQEKVEKEVAELRQKVAATTAQLKSAQDENAGNVDTLITEREWWEKQMEAKEVELQQTEQELILRTAEGQAVRLKAKAQFQQYKAEQEAKLLRDQLKWETELRVLKLELERCEEELMKRGSGPPPAGGGGGGGGGPPDDDDDDDDGSGGGGGGNNDAERERAAKELAAELMSGVLAGAVNRAAEQVETEQKEEAEKQAQVKLVMERAEGWKQFQAAAEAWKDVRVRAANMIEEMRALRQAFDTDENLKRGATYMHDAKKMNDLFLMLQELGRILQAQLQRNGRFDPFTEAEAASAMSELKRAYNQVLEGVELVRATVAKGKKALKGSVKTSHLNEYPKPFLEWITQFGAIGRKVLTLFEELMAKAKTMRRQIRVVEGYGGESADVIAESRKKASDNFVEAQARRKEEERLEAEKRASYVFMEDPWAVSYAEAMSKFKGQLDILSELLTTETPSELHAAQVQSMKKIGDSGALIRMHLNRLLIMAGGANKLDPQMPKLKEVLTGDESPTKWLIDSKAKEWWLRDGGAAIRNIEHFAQKIKEDADTMLFQAEGRFAHALQLQEDARKSVEGSAQQVQQKREQAQQSGDAAAIESAKTLARASKIKDEITTLRAEAELEVATAQRTLLERAHKYLCTLHGLLLLDLVPHLEQDGGENMSDEDKKELETWYKGWYGTLGKQKIDGWLQTYGNKVKEAHERAAAVARTISKMTATVGKTLGGMSPGAVESTIALEVKLEGAENEKSKQIRASVNDMLEVAAKYEQTLTKFKEVALQENKAANASYFEAKRVLTYGVWTRGDRLKKSVEYSNPNFSKEALEGRNSKEMLESLVQMIKMRMGCTGSSHTEILTQAAEFLGTLPPGKGRSIAMVAAECASLARLQELRQAGLQTAFFNLDEGDYFNLVEQLRWYAANLLDANSAVSRTDYEGILTACLTSPLYQAAIEKLWKMTQVKLTMVTTLVDRALAASAKARAITTAAAKELDQVLYEHSTAVKKWKYDQGKDAPVPKKMLDTLEANLKGVMEAVPVARAALKQTLEAKTSLDKSDERERNKRHKGTPTPINWKQRLENAWPGSPNVELLQQVADLLPVLELASNAVVTAANELFENVVLHNPAPDFEEAHASMRKGVHAAIDYTNVLRNTVARFVSLTGTNRVQLQRWVVRLARGCRRAVTFIRDEMKALLTNELRTAASLSGERKSQITARVRSLLAYYERKRALRIAFEALEAAVKAIFEVFYPWQLVHAAEFWFDWETDPAGGFSKRTHPGMNTPSVDPLENADRTVALSEEEEELIRQMKPLVEALSDGDQRVWKELILKEQGDLEALTKLWKRLVLIDEAGTDDPVAIARVSDDKHSLYREALKGRRVRPIIDAMSPKEKDEWKQKLKAASGDQDAVDAILDEILRENKDAVAAARLSKKTIVNKKQLTEILQALTKSELQEMFSLMDNRKKGTEHAMAVMERYLNISMLPDAVEMMQEKSSEAVSKDAYMQRAMHDSTKSNYEKLVDKVLNMIGMMSATDSHALLQRMEAVQGDEEGIKKLMEELINA